MKKKYFYLTLFFALCCIFVPYGRVNAYAAQDESVNDKLNEEIDLVIEDIDLSELENYISDISDLLSDKSSLKNLLLNFMKGQGIEEYDNALNYIFGLLINGLKSKLPVFISLFALLILCSIVNALSSERSCGVKDVMNFIGFAVIAGTVTTISVSLIYNAKDACDKVGKMIQIIFPLLLTLITVSGGVTQAAVYSPTTLFLGNFITVFVSGIMFPMVITMLVLNVVSNISKKIKLKGFIDFLSSFMKWGIGLAGVTFSIFLSVKGLNAGAFDGLSVKTLKYALSSTVPIVGGVVGGGAEIMLAAVALTKNALGTLSVLLVFGIVIKPVIEIASLVLALRLVNAVAQPLSGDNAYSFINSCVSVLNYAFAGLMLVSLMYSSTIIILLLSARVML